MKTNQPKYITYRGAKYEKISTLSEILVDPVPFPDCCVMYYQIDRYVLDIDSVEFYRGPAKKVAEDFLEDYKTTMIEDDSELLQDEATEVDQYSYIHYLGLGAWENDRFIVCTRGKGAYGNIYDLAKKWKDAQEGNDRHAAETALQGLINTLRHNYPV